MHQLIEELILQPIDVAAGPLWEAHLLKLCENEYVLIVVMEHMISDAQSMQIFLEELFAGYTQLMRGLPLSRVPLPIQFADYAIWQREVHSLWLKFHERHWKQHLAGVNRLRFPVDSVLSIDAGKGWGTVRLQITGDVKARLGEWCRQQRTTLVMAVFTAYAALVMRWCNVSEAVIQYQTDGRRSSKTHNVIGFFASMLYLRISVLESDRFPNLLRRITTEYCTAHEHADSSYMESRPPRPGFCDNTCFNWVPRGLAHERTEEGAGMVDRCPVEFENPVLKVLERDSEPVILLFDTEDGIFGGLHFSLNRFSKGSMQRLGRNFIVFISQLIERPEQYIKDIPLCD